MSEPNGVASAPQMNTVSHVGFRRDAKRNPIWWQSIVQHVDALVVAGARIEISHWQDGVQQDAGAVARSRIVIEETPLHRVSGPMITSARS